MQFRTFLLHNLFVIRFHISFINVRKLIIAGVIIVRSIKNPEQHLSPQHLPKAFLHNYFEVLKHFQKFNPTQFVTSISIKSTEPLINTLKKCFAFPVKRLNKPFNKLNIFFYFHCF